MKKEIKLFTCLRGLGVSTPLQRGDKLNQDTLITNDSSYLPSIITPETILSIGSLEGNFLKNSKSIVYSVRSLPDQDFDPQRCLIEFLMLVHSFLNNLWLIKDNAAYPEMAYIIYPDGQGQRIDSNFLSTVNTLSDGKTLLTEFNREELRKARLVLRHSWDNEEAKLSIDDKSLLQKGSHRISRAFYFLQIARSNADLAIKIANYCSSFESLFSTSTAELAHILSERVAVFIGSDSNDRSEIYRNMKNAYKIRSTVVHGSVLKQKNINLLDQVATTCDNYLRASMLNLFSSQKIFDLFSTDKNEELDQYFIERLFDVTSK